MTTPPPNPGYPTPPWNPPPAGLDRPAPGYPGGPPPPGWYPPPGPGYGPPQPKPGTNGFAVAALVFGFLGPLFAAVFGVIALNQIKRTGQGGRGLAIAGLVLAGVWVLVIAVGVTVAVATSAHRDGSGRVAAGGSVSSRDLRPGDCLNDLHDSTDVLSLPAVPCAQAHEGEVFAVFDLPAGPYPGPTAVDEQSTAGCNARFGDYSSVDPAEQLLDVVYPLPSNWARGDREVACIATPAAGGLTRGSLRR